jgi:hypothetical protein
MPSVLDDHLVRPCRLLKQWLDNSDPSAYSRYVELALRDGDFRSRLRSTGATDALIEACDRFKDLLLRRSIQDSQASRSC